MYPSRARVVRSGRLAENKLTDLVFAAKLCALEQLFVQGNEIITAADVEPVGEIATLTTLYLQNVDETAQNPVSAARQLHWARVRLPPFYASTVFCQRATQICQHIAYRPALTMRIPSMKNLDGAAPPSSACACARWHGLARRSRVRSGRGISDAALAQASAWR